MRIIRTAIIGAVVAGVVKAIRDRRARRRSLARQAAPHEDVDRLFVLIEQTPAHSGKALLFFELADAVAAEPELDERLRADLLALDPSEDEFDDKLAIVREAVFASSWSH